MIQELSKKLNSATYVTDDDYSWDIMSGGIVWADERADYSTEELNLVRELWAFRSRKILSESREKQQQTWDTIISLAPNWPGFRSERCEPEPHIIKFLAAKKASSDRYLDRMEKASKGIWMPLSGKSKNNNS